MRHSCAVDDKDWDELKQAAVEVMGRRGAMARSAEVAGVEMGDASRDHLALGPRQRALAAQQHLREREHRTGSLGAEQERAPDAGHAVDEWDVRHGSRAPPARTRAAAAQASG